MTIRLQFLLDEVALVRPHATAIVDDDGSTSFAELLQRVHAVAEVFGNQGVIRGTRVALGVEKTVETVAAILALFRIGATCVLLDPRSPRDRLKQLLHHALPALFVGTSELTTELGLLGIDALPLSVLQANTFQAPRLQEPVADSEIAYCIYTSGSTGIPKGVQISHGAVSHFLAVACAEQYLVGPESRCMSFSPLFFDVFVEDLLLPLSVGASVYLHRPPAVPNKICRILSEARITHFVATPSMLTLLTRATNFREIAFSELRQIVSGAEVLPASTVTAWFSKCPSLEIVNGYGPTEVTCSATSYFLRSRVQAADESIPIGKPLTGVDIWLRLANGRLTRKPGVKGELMLGGKQLMEGYWRASRMTKKCLRMVDDLRFYRTGDLCILREDGNLVYLGRVDDEIKLLGHRIHPNEVARVAGLADGAVDCHAVLIQKGDVPAIAVATSYERRVKAADVLAAMEAQCRSQLPQFMMPRYFFAVDSIPKLASGKTDRRALTSFICELVEVKNGLAAEKMHGGVTR